LFGSFKFFNLEELENEIYFQFDVIKSFSDYIEAEEMHHKLTKFEKHILQRLKNNDIEIINYGRI
jgi:hypothetical protein